MSNLHEKKEKEKMVPLDALKARIADPSVPLEERKQLHNGMMEKIMNPKKDFDPENFDPMEGVEGYDAKKRPRRLPPNRLPTMGLKPKELLEGQMVGMFESKQDLYLLIAHTHNTLWDAMEKMEKEVDRLTKELANKV